MAELFSSTRVKVPGLVVVASSANLTTKPPVPFHVGLTKQQPCALGIPVKSYALVSPVTYRFPFTYATALPEVKALLKTCGGEFFSPALAPPISAEYTRLLP